MTIEITQADIDAAIERFNLGYSGICEHCPIAQAVKRTLKIKTGVRMGVETLRIGNKYYSPINYVETQKLEKIIGLVPKHWAKIKPCFITFGEKREQE